MVLTPQNLERLLTTLNARLREQAAQARPQIKEIKKAFAAVEREIANYTRAIGRGDFTSLEVALTAAETRRTTLTAELARLDGIQPRAVLQLTPAALQHRLQGLIEEFCSGEPGRVREAIQATVGRIVVAADGTLTLEAKPEGLLGLDGTTVPLWCRGSGPIMERTIRSGAGRHWRVIGIG